MFQLIDGVHYKLYLFFTIVKHLFGLTCVSESSLYHSMDGACSSSNLKRKSGVRKKPNYNQSVILLNNLSMLLLFFHFNGTTSCCVI